MIADADKDLIHQPARLKRDAAGRGGAHRTGGRNAIGYIPPSNRGSIVGDRRGGRINALIAQVTGTGQTGDNYDQSDNGPWGGQWERSDRRNSFHDRSS
jgi:hypothetical protein